MDNITHSLVGVVIAKAVEMRMDSNEKRRASLKTQIFWTAVIASNLPDADILFNLVNRISHGPSKLDYLLYHRGYTHTLLACIPLALLSALVICALNQKKKKGLSVFSNFWLLLGVAAFSILCHLGMDFLNDYGVHVFSPFFNRWYYGDILFIVEPYLWLSLIPFAFFRLTNPYAKAFWALLGLGMILVLWLGSFTTIGATLSASIWALSSILLQRNASLKTSLRFAFASIASVICIFAGGSSLARKSANEMANAMTSKSEKRSVVTTAVPANPLCWRVWVTTRSENQLSLISRLGVISIVPALSSAEDCDPGVKLPRTAKLESADWKSTPGIAWKGRSLLFVEEFNELSEKSCEFRNFLKFSRLPFIQKEPSSLLLPARTVVGDLRYDRSPDLGFAILILNDSQAKQSCPGDSAPWEPPFFK